MKTFLLAAMLVLSATMLTVTFAVAFCSEQLIKRKPKP